MKLYLAGGYGIMNVIGREREVSKMMPTWKRLFSYHFLHLIYKSEILNIRKDANQEDRIVRGTGNSKAGTRKQRNN
jgi:hypothetical protein